MASTERDPVLEALEKKARPALDDARLVALARDKKLAPRVVRKRAEALDGLSRRQPEAARCMAVIRRDYGLKALDLYISSMARARADLSVTEQAHRGEIMETRKLQSILTLTDVRTKFELLIKNGYGKEAADFLLELATNGRAFCWLGVGGDKIINPLGKELLGKFDSNKVVNGVLLVFRKDLKEGFKPLGDGELQICLMALVKILEQAGAGDTTDIVPQIVEAILRNTVKHNPRGEGPAEYWNVLGTMVVARHMWPVNKRSLEEKQWDLAYQVEIWQARYHFFVGERGTMPQNVLPSLEKHRSEVQNYRWFDWLVEYLQECGWSIEQVRQEFIEWLEWHAESDLNNQIFVAVAGSPCLRCGLTLPKARAALHLRFKYCWQQLCREDPDILSLGLFAELGRYGLFSTEDRASFRVGLTDLMAQGKTHFVARIIHAVGMQAGLGELDLTCCAASQKKAVRGVMFDLAPRAFDKAIEAQRYGVAAALGQCFNCVDETQLRLKANRHFRDQLLDVVNWEYVAGSDAAMENALLHVLDGKCEKSGLDDDGNLELREEFEKWRLFWPNDTRGKGVSEATAQKFFALREERDELLKTLIEIRKTEIKGAVETALALEMPIALDVVTLL